MSLLLKKSLIKITKPQNTKIAVVTGGARRLGRQISYFLAEEGYELAIIYHSSSEKELKKTYNHLTDLKSNFRFYKCDIRNLFSLKKTIYKIGKEFKKIDVLINNSGTIKKIDFGEITPELFENTININLRAPLFASQFALKYLNKSFNPCIINIASLGGLQNWSGFIPYSLSKSSVVKLTYLLARKLAPKIRVNAIAPGTIIIEGEEKGAPGKIPVEKIPLKKYGKPRDIIEAIRFILRCDYLTGHVIPVDGGRLLA